jgi:hypothetical protein
MLTDAEFARALARLGPDLAAWPPYVRREAQAALMRSPKARVVYLAALEGDAALGALSEGGNNFSLLQQLTAQIARAPQASPPPRWSAWQAGGLLACAALGAVAGMQISRPAGAPTQVAALTSLIAADDLP